MTVVVSGRKMRAVGDAKSWPLAGLERSRSYGKSKTIDLIASDVTASYVAIYASQPWVYSLVNKLARGGGRIPLKSYALDANEVDANTRERIRKHPLPLLLSRPYPRGSTGKLVQATIGSIAVYGHALWWKFRQRAGQAPIELWPLDWRYVTPHGGETDPVEYFEYRGPGGGKKIMLADDVVHFSWWSPDAAGTSPLEPLRTTLALEDAARRTAVASFANGVRPSGALITPESLKPREKKELRAEIEGMHSTPDAQFRMMLLDGGLDWKTFSHTAQEAETIAHRRLNREEAAAVYDVPPPVVQILDRATFSNITEQRKMLYGETMAPWFAEIEDTIMSQLVWGEPELALAGAGRETYVEFDLAEILKPDAGARATAYSQFRAAGVYTANELRAFENRPRIDHPLADAILIPLNMLPVGKDIAVPDLADVQAAALALSGHAVTLPASGA